MKKQKQQGIKKRLTKGFVKAAVIGAIAAMIGVVALLIAASQYEKALNRYGFTQGDIGKAMTAFSESRSALRAVVGYDEEAVIKKQTELHTEKKEAFNTYMEELDRTLRFDEGRTAYDEVLRALDGYWELDEQVLQLAVSDDADVQRCPQSHFYPGGDLYTDHGVLPTELYRGTVLKLRHCTGSYVYHGIIIPDHLAASESLPF